MNTAGNPGAAPARGERLEPLWAGYAVLTADGHTFGTDTILLADFSMPRPGETCADLGTGCGAIPILWCARSSPAAVYAAELQRNACALAERSVRLNGLERKIRVVRGDVRRLPGTGALPRGLDLIACNPPYGKAGCGVPSAGESRRVARQETCCGFSDFARTAGAFLRWGGRFCFCLRPDRLCEAADGLRAAGIEPKRLRFVQQRDGKAPFLFLLEGRRGGKPGLAVEPTLLVESPGGGPSPETLRIYGGFREGRT